MKKAITLTSIIAAASQLLYVILSFFVGMIYVFVKFRFNKPVLRGFRYAVLDQTVPAVIVFLLIGVAAAFVILTIKKQSKNIVVEVVTLVWFSGIFEIFRIIPNPLANKIINDMLMNDAMNYTNSYSSYIGFGNVAYYFGFLAAVASALVIAALVMSIIYKKVVMKYELREEKAEIEASCAAKE